MGAFVRHPSSLVPNVHKPQFLLLHQDRKVKEPRTAITAHATQVIPQKESLYLRFFFFFLNPEVNSAQNNRAASPS